MGILASLFGKLGANPTSQSATEELKPIDRRKIPPEEIDLMQRIEASEKYRKKIYRKFYLGYPEKPYISQDREFNTRWLEFPGEPVKRKMMVRYSDGLLPGHVYMLFWLSKGTKRRIPSYFEYRYGIDFEKERLFLLKNQYIDAANKPTERGKAAMERHKKVIEERHPQPLQRGTTASVIPQQKPNSRVTSAHTDAGSEAIPTADMDLLRSEIAYINDALRSVCKLSRISRKLSLDLDGFDFGIHRNGTYYEWGPLTSAGRASKYPLVLRYHSIVKEPDTTAYDAEYDAWMDFLRKGGTTAQWERIHGKLKDPPISNKSPDESFGAIYYLQSGLIGGANMIFWCSGVGYFIDLGLTNGALALKKVTRCKPPDKVCLYKE